MKSVDVYWATQMKEGLRAKAPYSLFKKYSKDKNVSDYNYLMCPSVIDAMSNILVIPSMYDFELSVGDDGKYILSDLSQEDFDRLIHVRNVETKLLSIRNKYILFADDKNLEVSILPAWLDDNSFSNNTMTIPGVMDIANWFRPLEASFHLKGDCKNIKIRMGDPLFYVRFNTDKKINLIRYKHTEKLHDLSNDCINTRGVKAFKRLSYYYDIFKGNNMKNKIITEIKNNLYD